jgi:hypothetical protein
VKPKAKIMIIIPGKVITHQLPLGRRLRPFVKSHPQSGTLTGTPNPIKVNPAAVRIASAKFTVATTTIDGKTLGKM